MTFDTMKHVLRLIGALVRTVVVPQFTKHFHVTLNAFSAFSVKQLVHIAC